MAETTYAVSSAGGPCLTIPAASPREAAQFYRRLALRAPDAIDGKPFTPKRANKFNAQRTEHDGRTFDSKAEAKYAAELDVRIKLGEVAYWLPQPIVRLGAITFRPDFLVVEYRRIGGVLKSTAIENVFVDVKGADTQRFRDICKLWREHGPARLLVVREKGGVEVIEGKGGES